MEPNPREVGRADRASRPLRVVLDARLEDGQHGGVQQTIIGLAAGLGRLGGDDEYLFLTSGPCEWLKPHLSGRCTLLQGAPAAAGSARLLARAVLALRPMRRVFDTAPLARLVPLSVPPSDGTIERAGADVMHFTFQDGFITRVPSIYNPHDLQHLHHPELISPLGLRWRQRFYPTLAHQASAVVALSEWGKRDLAAGLTVPPEKVFVIGWAPPVDAYPTPRPAELAQLRKDHGLPERFALYPAQTFPHKNHLGLLEALRLARDEARVRIPVVFTGTRNDHYGVVADRVRRLELQDQVTFLGFVKPAALWGLYHLARMLVFPSRFEGFGMPVIEAFRAGIPVACSNAPALPEVAGDAALLFPPDEPRGMAQAIVKVWTDETLRAALVERGLRRVQALSWTDVARRYRALYRLAARRPLAPDDAALLGRVEGSGG